MNINEMKVEDLNKIITICNILIKKENTIKESSERIESMIKQFEIIDTKEEDIKSLMEEVKVVINNLEDKKEESLKIVNEYKIDTSKIEETIEKVVEEYKPNTNQLKNELDDIVKGYQPTTKFILEDLQKIESDYEINSETINNKLNNFINNYKINEDDINLKVKNIIEKNESYRKMISLKTSLNKFRNWFLFLSFVNIFVLGMNYLTNKGIENFVLKNDVKEILLIINNDRERIDRISEILWSNDLIDLKQYNLIKNRNR